MAKKTKTKKESPKKDDFLSKCVDVNEIKEPLITTLWGKPGTGKTRIAASWPKPILFLDIVDKGTTSAQSKDLKKGEIMVRTCKDWDDVLEALDWVEDNPDHFKTVVVDHMTNLQEMFKKHLLVSNNRNKMTQPLWGELSQGMKEFILRMRHLVDEGIEPVFIAEDRTDQPSTDDEDVILDPDIGPALQPAVQKFLTATSKIVGRTYIASYDKKVKEDGKTRTVPTIEFRLGIGPNQFYQTKIRKPRGAYSPDYLVDASYQDLVTISEGNYPKPEAEKSSKKKKK